MLTRFSTRDYKCLRQVEIPLSPLHVLIGQNDSGKTSLLEAIFALYRSATASLVESFPGNWQGRELVCEGSPTPFVQFAATWQGAADSHMTRYHLQVRFAELDRQCRVEGEAYVPPSGNPLEFPSSGENSTAVQQFQMGREPFVSQRGILEPLSRRMGVPHFYRLDPKMMALPSTLDSGRRFRMDRDGFGLPGLLDDILGHDAHRFVALREQFCSFFPQFRSVRIETEPAVQRDFKETGLHSSRQAIGKGIHFETRDGMSIRAQQASDGAILLLGFLALAALPVAPRMILIEEPETGIYPKRLDQVIRLLREFVSQGGTGGMPQIVMTTHSPYVLSSFLPEEVTLMSRRPSGEVVARPLRDAPHIHERLGSDFYLGELWYNLSEEDLFGD